MCVWNSVHALLGVRSMSWDDDHFLMFFLKNKFLTWEIYREVIWWGGFLWAHVEINDPKVYPLKKRETTKYSVQNNRWLPKLNLFWHCSRRSIARTLSLRRARVLCTTRAAHEEEKFTVIPTEHFITVIATFQEHKITDQNSEYQLFLRFKTFHRLIIAFFAALSVTDLARSVARSPPSRAWALKPCLLEPTQVKKGLMAGQPTKIA